MVQDNVEQLLYAGIAVFFVIIVFAVCFGVFHKFAFLEKRKNQRANQRLLQGLFPVIPSNFVKKENLVGKGHFGNVYRGTALIQKLKGGNQTGGADLSSVALKILSHSSADPSEKEKRSFLEEAAVQSTLKHEHIAQFLGISNGITHKLRHACPGKLASLVKDQEEISDGRAMKFLPGLLRAKRVILVRRVSVTKFVVNPNDPETDELMVVLEYLEGGNLLDYLQECKLKWEKFSESLSQHLLDIGSQLSSGCQYLEEQKYVHRDIAARNCLLTSRDPETLVVKLGDFGMARDIYFKHYYCCNESYLPWNWLAPESFPPDARFSTKSDVWAFGVLMWEIFTMGEFPYASKSTTDVEENVTKHGSTLQRPSGCPENIFGIIQECFQYKPGDRPKFGKIEADLKCLAVDMTPNSSEESIVASQTRPSLALNNETNEILQNPYCDPVEVSFHLVPAY